MKLWIIMGGFLVTAMPIGFLIAFELFGYMAGGETRVLWPSTIMLMALNKQSSIAVSSGGIPPVLECPMIP